MADFATKTLKLVSVRPGDENNKVLVLDHGEGELWVDPAKTFVPVRYTELKNGAVTRVVEISYALDAHHGWLPSGWKNEMGNADGSKIFSDSVKVTRFSLNEEIPETTFQLKLPPNTWAQSSIFRTSYITREDGTTRDVVLGEYNGKNFEEIKRTEKGELLKGPNY
jgi:hypothetical protein